MRVSEYSGWTRASADQTAAQLQIGGLGLDDCLRMALRNLRANKLRTFLTTLGVIIGVSAVITLLALGRGAQQQITAELTANGANLLTINAGSPGEGVLSHITPVESLTLDDAEALADAQNVPAAERVSPQRMSVSTVSAGRKTMSTFLIGATPAYFAIHNHSLIAGTELTDDQIRRTANVVVLGGRVATTLFEQQDAVGQTIRIQGQRFRVIGVLAFKGGDVFGSVDDSIILPISTVQRKLIALRVIDSGGKTAVSSIVVQARGKEQMQAAVQQIETTLRRRHRLPVDGSGDDFTISNQQDMIDALTRTSQTLTIYLGAIAAISLLVGGIGIMNIMLVSVHERTREIGLRKALGARERDILHQFLIEALTLSTSGGITGVVLGFLITAGINLSGRTQASISIESVLLALGFAIAVGIFFGIEPAKRAARLDPIIALRS